MPLHDWTDLSGWEGMHLFWIAELARNLKDNLPSGFRAYLGSGPAIAIGAPPARPDISVRAREVPARARERDETWIAAAPDVEVAVATLEAEPSLLIERDGRLVAAIEIISPQNKDTPIARINYGRRYAGYLLQGVNLLLIDVQPRPAGFSFAGLIADELQVPDQPALEPPMAVSYRVGEPAPTGGRFLAIWRFPFTTRAKLPTVTIALDINLAVPVDLDATYTRAANDAYLSDQ